MQTQAPTLTVIEMYLHLLVHRCLMQKGDCLHSICALPYKIAFVIYFLGVKSICCSIFPGLIRGYSFYVFLIYLKTLSFGRVGKGGWEIYYIEKDDDDVNLETLNFVWQIYKILPSLFLSCHILLDVHYLLSRCCTHISPFI